MEVRGYRSSRRAEQARHTRRRVLEAATTVFLERGYAGTTMRAVAAAADVAVPTVELAFGTKARLLHAAIDVAIAGDDEPVPVLDRDWTDTARAAATVEEFLATAADVLAAAQSRSAGLVLAVFEGARTDPDLAALAAQRTAERFTTAAWLVDRLVAISPLRSGLDHADAAESVWVLMEPAVFDRLVRHRGGTPQSYARWFARSARRLLLPDNPERTSP